MSVVLRAATEDIELGASSVVRRVFAELGALEPEETYGALRAVPHYGDDEVPQWYRDKVRVEAAQFLRVHGPALSRFARGILEEPERAVSPDHPIANLYRVEARLFARDFTGARRGGHGRTQAWVR
jgi:hypothetical protein